MGAGAFAQGMHLPNLQRLKNLYHLRAIVSATGNNAKNIGTQFGAEYVTTNYEEVLADPNVDLILICTRHHQHAAQAIAAARAGKAVLLEKPVALNPVELNDLVSTLGQTATPFTVGFNRRFSIYAQEIRRHTSQRINPLFMRYRMNAGFIPREHWVHGAEGGGRIVGEACHIIDLFTSFTESKIESVSAARLNPRTASIGAEDNVSITLRYADGSVGVLDYFAVGSKELPKENLEIHFDEKTIVLDDYKALKGSGVKVKSLSSLNSDKGHFEELQLFHQALKDGRELIPMWDWAQTTEATFKVRDL
jgi:predicted dehydrogenase